MTPDNALMDRLLAADTLDDDDGARLVAELAAAADWPTVAGAVEDAEASGHAARRLAVARLLNARTSVEDAVVDAQEAAVLRRLAADDDADVAAEAICGAGRLRKGRDLRPLAVRAADEAADVREAVAFALTLVLEAELDTDPADVRAAEAALLALADDPEDDVRSWALFGIGPMLGLRTPEALEVLGRHRADPHHESRCEALEGLALAGDRDALLASLADCDLTLALLDAAVAAGGDDVRRALEAIRAAGAWQGAPEDLDDAIGRCSD